jgi:hypothetical protein
MMEGVNSTMAYLRKTFINDTLNPQYNNKKEQISKCEPHTAQGAK